MARYNHANSSFSSGELGEKTRARFDIDEYSQGLATLENMIPYKSGGVTRRPGTRHIAKVTSVLGPASIVAGLYPFVFSQTEAYNIVITPNNNAPDSAVQVFRRDGSAVTIVYNTGGTNYFTLPSFDAALDANGFQYAQSADILYFTHSSGAYPPFVVKRLAEDSFEIQHIWGLGEIFEPVLTTPYLPANVDTEKLLYFNAITTLDPFKIQRGSLDQRTVFSVDSSGVSIDTVFDSSHEGSVWRLTESGAGKEAAFYIETVAVDKLSATVRVLIGFDASLVGVAQRDDNWKEGQWSDVQGWPRTVTFFDQRLIFGGNTKFPDTLWISRVGNFKIFMSDKLDQDILTDLSGLGYFGEILNSDGFDANIASTEVNDINWLAADSELVCGTTGVEYAITPIDGIFGRNNISVKPKSSYGSKPIQAFKGGEGIMYVSRDGKRIRRFKFSIDTGEQSNVDITTLNSDIIYHNPNKLGTISSTEFKSITVKQMAWQESRSTMWFVTSNKALIGFTIDQKSGVAGWHRHDIATASGNQAEVIGVSVLPNEDNTYLDVWILVSRLVFVDTIVTLEKISDDFEHDLVFNTSPDENDHPFYLDSSVRYTASEASATRTFLPTQISTADESITFLGKHRYHQGQEVRIATTGVIPPGLSAVTDYYLIVESDITFYLAISPADATTGKSAAVNITGLGSGIHSIVPTAVATLTKWSGLNHLSDQPILALVDGVSEEGTVDIKFELTNGIGEQYDTAAASELIIGMQYKSTLKTLPLEAGGQLGASRGNITRIDRATLIFYKTYTGKFGSDENDLEDIEMETTPLTGDQKVDFPSGPDRLAQVIVETESALPLSLLGMTLRGQSNEG